MSDDWVEFDVGGAPYKARKLPAMTQMKIIKRVAPAYSHFREFARASVATPARVSDDGAKVEPTPADLAAEAKQRDETYSAFARALTELRDDDLEFIIREAMSNVQRQEPSGAWVSVWNRQANAPMFPDIRFNVILSVVLAVLQAEFAGFFR